MAAAQSPHFSPLLHDTTPKEPGRISALSELKGLMKLAWPIMGSYFLELSPAMVNIVIVGHLSGGDNLGAVSLGNLFCVFTAMSPAIGLATAVDALGSQAFGANNPTLIGIYVQQGLLIFSFVFVFAAILSFYSSDVLIAIGQPREISILAGSYCRWFLTALPSLFVFELVKKAMMATGNVVPLIVAAAAGNIANAAAAIYFVQYTSFGYVGAAIARAICYFVMMCGLFVSLAWTGKHRLFWGGFTWQAIRMRGICTFLRYGVPGMFTMCLEWWAFEGMTVMAGLLPHSAAALGTTSLMLNLSTMLFCGYFGMGLATGVRIGTLLGAGQPAAARRMAKLGISLNFALSVLVFSILVGFREQLPPLLVKDPAIQRLVLGSMVPLAVYQFPNGLNACAASILRSVARPQLAVGVLFITFYIIALPGAAVLGFVLHMSVPGFLYATAIALALGSLTEMAIVLCFDWALLSREAIVRSSISTHGDQEYEEIVDVPVGSPAGLVGRLGATELSPTHSFQQPPE